MHETGQNAVRDKSNVTLTTLSREHADQLERFGFQLNRVKSACWALGLPQYSPVPPNVVGDRAPRPASFRDAYIESLGNSHLLIQQLEAVADALESLIEVDLPLTGTTLGGTAIGGTKSIHRS